MRPCALVLLLLLAGCSPPPGEPAPASSSPAGPLPTFAREAFLSRVADAGAAEPPVPLTADPDVLHELLAAVPSAPRRAGTAPDGGTAVGADTKIRADGGVELTRVAAPRLVEVSVGKPTQAGDLADPAVERAARAQLYWGLTQRCRRPDGGVLPPEAVRLTFQLDVDGSLVTSSIIATTKEERFAEAARCMQRELSTMPFRAPAAARGARHIVRLDVPAVD